MWAFSIFIIFSALVIIFATVSSYTQHSAKILELNFKNLEKSRKSLIDRNTSLTNLSLDKLLIKLEEKK